ncbi:Galactose-1-phosphate uridylyltransferase [Aphelenchoides besseyi]|nr:Galactose-1-phosphate uridylyltransferase [Aphelenchoides besseyi]
MSGQRVKNILTGDWVITSPAGRLNRPWKGELSANKKDEDVLKRETDPLAPGAIRGNGKQTPNFEYTHIFRNDFAVFNDPDSLDKKDLESDADEVFITGPCSGVNDVLIYSPDYDKHFSQMNARELNAVFESWNEYYQSNKEKYEYIQIFENRGAEVGSSLPHPHCQIWSTKFVPTTIEKMYNNQKSYYEKHAKAMLPIYLQKELQCWDRVVKESEHFVILVPFWAYWPYEVLILPRRNFQSIDQMTKTTSVPYVMGLRNSPSGSYLSEKMDFWTFHVNICPPLLNQGRKKYMAGYELLSEVQRDFDTNTAAQRLRDAA